jgi:hypothetical protein
MYSEWKITCEEIRLHTSPQQTADYQMMCTQNKKINKKLSNSAHIHPSPVEDVETSATSWWFLQTDWTTYKLCLH